MPRVAQTWQNHIFSGVTPEIEVDMQDYDDTADLLSDSATWVTSEDKALSGGAANSLAQIVLDTVVAAPGYIKSMRYDFNHGDNGCTSPEIRRLISFSERQEVWIEILRKYSTNFTTHQAACFPNDHKVVFIETVDDLSFRFGYHVGMDGDPSTGTSHSIGWDFPLGEFFPSESSRYAGISANTLWESDAWITDRFHVKASTTVSSADGQLHHWINGVLRKTATGFNMWKPGGTVPERLNGVSFTHNKDDGPANVLMSMWFQRIRIYDQNPGW